MAKRGNPAWKKGMKGGPGRPKGSKDHNWLNPIWWFNFIREHCEEMTNEQKISVAFKALELIMPKVPAVPATPDESVANAKSALDLLKGIEERPIPPPIGGPIGNGSH